MTERLPDKLESNGRVEVRHDGTVIGTRRIIDFVSSGGDADDGGVDDKVTVDMSAFAPAELWTLTSGDLAPTNIPDSFTVTTNDDSTINSTNITLNASSGETELVMTTDGQTTLSGTDWISIQGANETFVGVATPFYATTDMPNSSVLFAPDEGSDMLTIVWKYSDGTVKTLALGPFA